MRPGRKRERQDRPISADKAGHGRVSWSREFDAGPCRAGGTGRACPDHFLGASRCRRKEAQASAQAPGGPVLIASDTGANPNPDYFWGGNSCASDQRVQQITTGGDPTDRDRHATGRTTAFRRLTVFDGDDSTGERCELGWDNREEPDGFLPPGRPPDDPDFLSAAHAVFHSASTPGRR